MFRQCMILLILIALSLFGVAPATVSGSVVSLFWADSSDQTIKRSNLDGSGVSVVVSEYAHTLDVDTLANKIYWGHGNTNKIHRANLDGSGIEEIYSGGQTVREIVVDAAGGHLYWVEQGHSGASIKEIGLIRRSDLDGSNVIDLVTKLGDPFGIDLDVAGGKMYWTSGTTPGGIDKLQRANLDGSNVEDLLVAGTDGVHGIALDPLNNKMYFPVNYPTEMKIHRANLDGTNSETLLTGSGDWRSIALYQPDGKVYFQQGIPGGQGRISRMNFDGSDVETIVSTGDPNGITIAAFSAPIPEPSSIAMWSALGIIGLAVARRKRKKTRTA